MKILFAARLPTSLQPTSNQQPDSLQRRVLTYVSKYNSPGLWPQACQILDMNQSIKKSIIQSTLGSWFLVFGAWVLGPIVFLIHRARIWGCARGGVQGDVPRAFGTHTPLQLRLKIALVFDTLFVRF